MRLLIALPLLCLTPGALAGVLELFTRDRCFPNPCYRAVKAASTASADCYLPTLPAYASSCHDTSHFSSACSCLGISSAAPTSTTTTPPVLTSSSPIVGESYVDTTIITTTTISSTITTTITIAATSTTTVTLSSAVATSVATTCTDTVTAWSTKTITASPLATASGVSQVAVVQQPSTCLSDAQATNIATAYHDILTNPDRSTVYATADDLIADDFFEMSGSVNSLSGQAVTNITFPTRAAYLASLSLAPAIPAMTTLDIFHDCNRIAWYWAVTSLGSGTNEVRGVSLIYTIPQPLEAAAVAVGGVDDGGAGSAASAGVGVGVGVEGSEGYGNRKVNMVMLEFNSVAWAADTGRVLCAGGCAA